MPRITSLVVSLPSRLSSRSPSSPHQFVRSASTVVGCARIAGVQSTVWIFAISAELTSRALSYRSWSSSSGCRSCKRRQAEVVDSQLAVGAQTERLGERDVPPVDLGGVPPVRVVRDEGRRPVRVG